MPDENQEMTLFELLIDARCDLGGLDVYNYFEIVSPPLTNIVPPDGLLTFRKDFYPTLWLSLKERLSAPPSPRLRGACLSVKHQLRLYDTYVVQSEPPPYPQIDYRLLSIKVRKCDRRPTGARIVFQGGVKSTSGAPIMIALSINTELTDAVSLQSFGIVDAFRMDLINGNYSVESLVFRPANTTASNHTNLIFDINKRRLVPLAPGQQFIYGLEEMQTSEFNNLFDLFTTPGDLIRLDPDYAAYVHRSILSGYINIREHRRNLNRINMRTLRQANEIMRVVHRKVYKSDKRYAYDYPRILLTNAYGAITSNWRESIIPILNLHEFGPIIDFIVDTINSFDTADAFLASVENLIDIFFINVYRGQDHIESFKRLINYMRNAYVNIDASMGSEEDENARVLFSDFPTWMSMQQMLTFLDSDMLTTIYPDGRTELLPITERINSARGQLRARELLVTDYEHWDGDTEDGEDGGEVEDVRREPRRVRDVANDYEEFGDDYSDDDEDNDEFVRVNPYHSDSMRTNVGNVNRLNYKKLDEEDVDVRRDYIGLELEFAHDGCKHYKGSNYDYARRSFTNLLSSDFDIGRHFDLSNDSSLNDCGAEMVSLPMTYKYILSKRDMFTTIFDAMREDDMLALGGFHVHFGRDLIDGMLYHDDGNKFPDYSDRLGIIEALFDNLFYDTKNIDVGTNQGRGTFETFSTAILGREANPYCQKNNDFNHIWRNNLRSHRNWLSVNDVTFEFRTPSIPFNADDFYNKLYFLVEGINIIRDYMFNDYPNGVERSVAVAKIRHHIITCFENKMAILIKALENESKDIPINSQIPFYNTYRKLVSYNKSFGYFTKENMLRDMTILLNMSDVFRRNSVDYNGWGNDNSGYVGNLFGTLGYLVDNGIMKIGVKMKGGN